MEKLLDKTNEFIIQIGDQFYCKTSNTLVSCKESATVYYNLGEALQKVSILIKTYKEPTTIVPLIDKTEWVVFHIICSNFNSTQKLKQFIDKNDDLSIGGSKLYLDWKDGN